MRHAEAPFNIHTEPARPGNPRDRGFIDQPTPHTGAEPANRVDIEHLVGTIRMSDAKNTVNRWVGEGHAAGVAWSPLATPTVRCYEIARAALRVAEVCGDEADDVALALIGLVPIGSDWPDVDTVGAALGNLTVSQAAALHDVADQFEQGLITLRYGDDGAPALIEGLVA